MKSEYNRGNFVMMEDEEANMKEAMAARHTVRRYKDTPLPDEVVENLNARVSDLNQKYNLSMRLIVNDREAFGPMLRTFFAKGVRNYFVLAGPDTPALQEKLGWCSADLMLYAQTLGLNTWWIGLTFNRKNVDAGTEGKLIGIVAVGYGAVQGAPHKSKQPDDVAEYDGEVPAWFAAGTRAALLAPTAMNRQAFSIRGSGTKVSITYKDGAFSGADLGLVKYHFALGAGEENFTWTDEN